MVFISGSGKDGENFVFIQDSRYISGFLGSLIKVFGLSSIVFDFVGYKGV